MTSPSRSEEGMREFCEAEYPRLAGYCLSLTGDRQLARDLAQEAFVRVLGRWRTLSNPRPYLYVTATNLARRTWRRAATERAALDITASSAVLSAADPDDAVVIRALAEDLPRHLRTVTILYYFADLPVDDIAAGLKLPAGTVKRRLSDARRQLHQALSERRIRTGTEGRHPMNIAPHTPELLPPRSGDIQTILDQIKERRRRRQTRLIGGTGLAVIVAVIVLCFTVLIPRSTQTSTSVSIADVVRMNGIDYGDSATYHLPRSLLGHRIGTIERKLHIIDNGPHVSTAPITTMDTVSTTWPKGTAIYSVKGYRTTFRIAVVTRKQVQMYQVNDDPRARRGEEVLDIDGKVRQIDILNDRDRVLGHIRDADLIATLTRQIATARLNPDLRSDGTPLFLHFRLRDGTVARASFHDRPYLSPGEIIVPKSFHAAIIEATHHK